MLQEERERFVGEPNLPSDKNDDGCDDGSQEDEPSEHSQSDYSSWNRKQFSWWNWKYFQDIWSTELLLQSSSLGWKLVWMFGHIEMYHHTNHHHQLHREHLVVNVNVNKDPGKSVPFLGKHKNTLLFSRREQNLENDDLPG